MANNSVGAGMGTSGLVGQINAFAVMMNGVADFIAAKSWYVVLFEVLLVHIVLPAVITFFLSELFYKIGWIKKGDMKLES